jgi:hypothetical protein
MFEQSFRYAFLTYLLTYTDRNFLSFQEAIIDHTTTFEYLRVMVNFDLALNTSNKEQEEDIAQHIYLLIIPLWMVTPLQTLLPRPVAIRVGVHVCNGMASDSRFLNLTVNPNDDYGLFLPELHQELPRKLVFSRWVHHIVCADMMDFDSRLAILIIPDGMIYHVGLKIIDLLTQCLSGMTLQRDLHAIN